ncbi:MAG: S9 family peptidase [Bacteroidetes bacterium]|nr:MAG: S9 family peptidase [Bacteroidota bacterium]
MKVVINILIILLINAYVYAQNGRIIERNNVNLLLNEQLKDRILDEESSGICFKEKYSYLNKINLEEITYESDGNKVKGYIAYPKEKGNYPAIIYNRGGNLDFGSLNIFKAAFILAKVASWGYVVVGSQYRGNGDGVGGKDEFGGAEVNDILNLIPLLGNMEQADTSKLGIYGWSRGGMMTYLTLTKNSQFKAAVVGGGLSDLYMMKKTRPVMEEVYEDLIPDYWENKEKCLDERSAIKFVDKIPKTTPILMVHGTADWRVVPEMALELSAAFIKAQIPHRLVLFEGGDHGLNEFDDEVDEMAKQWFYKYLKEGKKLPDLKPHGR